MEVTSSHRRNPWISSFYLLERRSRSLNLQHLIPSHNSVATTSDLTQYSAVVLSGPENTIIAATGTVLGRKECDETALQKRILEQPPIISYLPSSPSIITHSSSPVKTHFSLIRTSHTLIKNPESAPEILSQLRAKYDPTGTKWESFISDERAALCKKNEEAYSIEEQVGIGNYLSIFFGIDAFVLTNYCMLIVAHFAR